MKKRFVSIMMCTAMLVMFFFMVTAAYAGPPGMGEERAAHPRIVKAIDALEDAIAYMKEAPHNFGGHKAEAIEACHKAIRQLNQALKYREREDRK
jgi:hypothetical protein